MKRAFSFLMAMAMVLSALTLPAMAATATGITPATGSADVSVFSDVVVTFDGSITQSDADALSITVSPEAAYTITADGTSAVIRFTEALAYNTAYTVTVGDLSTTFTTVEDTKDILFYEDFTDLTAAAEKFEQFGPADTTPYYIDATTLWSAKNALGFKVGTGSYHLNYANGAARAAIKGSENWGDINLEFTFGYGAASNLAVHLLAKETDGVYSAALLRMNSSNATNYPLTVYSYDLNNNSETSRGRGSGVEFNYDNDYYSTDMKMNVNFVGGKINTTLSKNDTGEVIDTYEDSFGTLLSGKGKVVFSASVLTAPVGFDNIKVTDLADFNFTVADIKDVNPVVLTFTKDLDEAVFSSDLFTAVDANGNAKAVTAELTGTNEVTLTMAGTAAGTLYDITVDQALQAADGTVLAGDKTFTVMSSGVVCSIAPTVASTPVSVLSDLVFSFEEEVSLADIGGSLTITPSAAYTLSQEGNNITMTFDEALAFDTTYTASCGSTAYTFTTEENEMDIIFYEDFQGDAAASAAKFSLFGTNGASTTDIPYGFSTDTRLAFTFDPDERSSLNARNMSNATPRVAIAGSKNWTKYKLEYDFTVGNYLCANFLMLGVADDTTGGAGVTFGYPNANYAGFYARYDGLPDTNINYSAMSEAANEATVYHHEAIVDPTVSLVSTVTNNTTGAEIFSLTVDSSTQYSSSFLPKMTVGNVVLAGNTNRTTFDNIKVTDLGFTFVPQSIKKVPGVVVLNFEDTLDETSFSSELVTASKDGEAVAVEAAVTGEKQITITLPEGSADGLYDFTVDSALKNTSGATMLADKTFFASVEMPLPPYAISGNAISDLTAGQAVTASATVTQNEALTQAYTYVLAVYNGDELYDVDVYTVSMNGIGTETLSAATKALPDDITGFTAKAFVLESLLNAAPYVINASK